MRFRPLQGPCAPCAAWLIRGVPFGLAGWMPQDVRQQLGSQLWGLEGWWESGSSQWKSWNIAEAKEASPPVHLVSLQGMPQQWQWSDCCTSPSLPWWEFLLPAQARRMEQTAEINLGIEKSRLHPGCIIHNAFSRSWAVDLTRDPSVL